MSGDMRRPSLNRGGEIPAGFRFQFLGDILRLENSRIGSVRHQGIAGLHVHLHHGVGKIDRHGIPDTSQSFNKLQDCR